MNRGITGLIVAGILVALALYGGTLLLVISVALLILMIAGRIKFEGKPSGTVSLIALVAIVIFSGVIPTTWGDTIQTASIVEPSIVIQEGAVGNAILKLNVKDAIGSSYAGSGTVYALPVGVVTDRNDLMKKIYDGNTGMLAPNSMALASSVYSYNGFSGKVGDTVVFGGYYDSSPAAAENMSFVKTAKITGITAGSTPEWMLSDAQYVWYNYPTLLFYDSSDAAKTIYNETEAAAIEKTFTVYMFPTNNGEAWTDSALWLESPSSSVANIKRISITPPNGGIPVVYGMPQEVSTSEAMFRAQPALTTTTNTMYYVGSIPDGVRTSTTTKGKVTIEVTYDHPASGNVLNYLKVTQNTNALTSSGGHFDSPAVPGFTLNMTDAGSDEWT